MIRIYQEGDHAGGFIGIRVAVKVGGELKQKYYNFRFNRKAFISLEEERLLLLDAQKLEQQWLKKKKIALTERQAKAEETTRKSKPMRTGVRGVLLTYARDKKFRAGEWRIYYSPVINVNGMHNKDRFFKTFRIMAQGYSEAWNKAVIFYAKNKGIKFYSHLLKRKPDISQFEVARVHLNKSRNYDIPNMGDKLILADKKVKVVKRKK